MQVIEITNIDKGFKINILKLEVFAKYSICVNV